MSGILLLCRHGNTFNKGDKVFMVGSRHDMELTKEGREQAESLGDALNRARLIPERIIAGPLKRTVEFAEIILTKLSSDSKSEQSSARIDNRLLELDYGEWEGLSDPEIKARWGEESFKLWQEQGIRPAGVTFSPSADHLEREARDVLEEQAGLAGCALLVTSSGRLREFSRVLGHGPKKVRTGHLCILKYEAGDGWKMIEWDVGAGVLEK
jgi:probable phosphoglycerate mutase